MTDKLPPPLLALFAPRPALRYLPAADHAIEERKTANIDGVAAFLPALAAEKEDSSDYVGTESWLQRRDRIKSEKKDRHQTRLAEGSKSFKPSEDPQVKGDPFKTLFVSRLSYDTEVKDLEREFARFGPIERIRIVKNVEASDVDSKKKQNRGYAFIVYEREKDMKAAYKETDGIRIKDRRILVDVERGRTINGWLPRRFGGGLGGRGYTKSMPAKASSNFSGLGPSAGPGGFRGGFRGGMGGPRPEFRGGRAQGGGRGGYGGRGGFSHGVNGGPEGAPSGPRGRGPPNNSGFGGYGARPFDGPSNGYRDRDRDRDRGGSGYYGADSRKRSAPDDHYDDSRRRRY